MSARLLEGRPVADAIWSRVEAGLEAVRQRRGRPPGLSLVCGLAEDAQTYARQIERQLGRHGFSVASHRAPTTEPELRRLLEQLSQAGEVDGVLLVTPLAEGIDVRAVIGSLDPAKDVDGQHPVNLGRLADRRPAFAPATALAGLRLLEHYGISLAGARATVVGRSPVVGLPLALLLLDANATVSVAHSRTQPLEAVTREAELLCVAIGRAGLIGPGHVRPGAVVLDFGTNVLEDGSVVGDMQTDAVAEVAAAVTPVPRGIGPITVAVLAEQTLAAAAGQ